MDIKKLRHHRQTIDELVMRVIDSLTDQLIDPEEGLKNTGKPRHNFSICLYILLIV